MHRTVIILVIFGLCSMVATKEPLRSHITGGYKNSETKNNVSDPDCSQFSSDYDVLRQFPFPIVINPIDHQWSQSAAYMKENDTFVKNIFILEEKVIPPSVFCLSKLEILHCETTPFLNDIVPDALANLKQLKHFWIFDAPIVKMTERLGMCSNLTELRLRNCTLTHLPNLSGLQKLWVISVPKNRLSHLDGIPDVIMLDLADNLFDHIPTIKSKESLLFLSMSNNPLKSMLPVMSFINLEDLFFDNLALTFIPASIDKLQNLTMLFLGDNKLSYLPTNILNLPHLEKFDISNNLFSSTNIQLIQEAFRKSRPNTELFV